MELIITFYGLVVDTNWTIWKENQNLWNSTAYAKLNGCLQQFFYHKCLFRTIQLLFPEKYLIHWGTVHNDKIQFPPFWNLSLPLYTVAFNMFSPQMERCFFHYEAKQTFCIFWHFLYFSELSLCKDLLWRSFWTVFWIFNFCNQLST